MHGAFPVSVVLFLLCVGIRRRLDHSPEVTRDTAGVVLDDVVGDAQRAARGDCVDRYRRLDVVDDVVSPRDTGESEHERGRRGCTEAALYDP